MNNNHVAVTTVASGILFVLGGGIWIASSDLLGSSEPSVGPVMLTAQLAIGVYAAGMATAAYRPFDRGHHKKALLYLGAVIGAIVVAVVGSSPVIWAGIALLGVAGVALIADALQLWSLEAQT